MNVPLKKRHNYGINGSASSQNEPTSSAQRVHSNNSNDEDDSNEYDDHDSSNVDDEDDDDDSSRIDANTTAANIGKEDRKRQQYLNMGRARSEFDARTVRTYCPTTRHNSESASEITASTHNSSKRNENKIPSSSSSSDSSDSSGSSKSSASHAESEVLGPCDPLTEEAVMQHNIQLEAMNSEERIEFWDCVDFHEFSEIVNDFDDKKYSSKPIRSERLQKRMYTQPAPDFNTSRKYKKDEKSRKTDNKKSSSTPKSKADPKEARKTKASPAKKPAKKPEPTAETCQPSTSKSAIQRSEVEQKQRPIPVSHSMSPSIRPLVHNSTPVSQPDNEIPSAIKIRVSYNKNTSIQSNDSFKIPTTPNTSFKVTNEVSCANCSKHSRSQLMTSMLSTTSSTEIPADNQEEFYKYLGIDTNPSVQEKVSPEPSPTDALYNNRRSLRVFIQQRQNEFSRSIANDKVTKDENSPRQKSPFAPQKSPQNVHNHSLENGKVFTKSPSIMNGTPVLNGGTLKPISSHIKQRHTYDASSDGDVQKQHTPDNSFNETENMMEISDNSNRFGESSGNQPIVTKTKRVTKRKVLLPSPMMLTEMFKRYRQCFKQGFVMRQQLRQQAGKRAKKKPSNNVQPIKETTSTPAENSTIENTAQLNGVQNNTDLFNTFSPTSITHSNASTDSAIVVNPNVNHLDFSINNIFPPTITVNSSYSVQCQQDEFDKTTFPNPLDMKNNGAVHAILTHSVSPNDNDVVVVVQESQISFWYSTSKALSMFGTARSWTLIGEIPRVTEDKEIDALYQHRLIDVGEAFPVYVEMRAKESAPDEFRQSHLTFVYLNVYFVKLNADRYPQVVMERVHLDTLKGYATSIYYIALKTSPCVLMTWTEHNVNNQTRCGIIKYTLKTPTLDNLDEIMDYSDLQHDIKTLYSISDYHVVGCGDRTVSMWDHRNGNLLIDIEIELPTIGHNIACYTVGDDIPDYMLLLQLTGDGNEEKQLKVMAVQTVDPYNWRTLQTHNIPNFYGKIGSIFHKDDMLVITFSSGTMLYLNLTSPHQIYTRNVSWSKPAPQTNGLSIVKPTNGITNLFTQCNGQTIELFTDHISIKSVWEYFIKKV